jgi:hypothetical protein
MTETLKCRALGVQGDTDVHLNELTSGAFEVILQNRTSTVQLYLNSVDALNSFARLVYWDDDDAREYDDHDLVLPPFVCDSAAGTCVACTRSPTRIAITFSLDSKIGPMQSYLNVRYLYGDDLWDFIDAFRNAHEQVQQRYGRDPG